MNVLDFAAPRHWPVAVAVALLAAALGVLGGPSRPVLASDPMGVYSLVGDVQYEPDKLNPDRIRVYGVHALSYRPKEGERRNWGIYTDPAPGYLYFTCPPGQLDVCQLQWQDLEKAIGAPRCAAYGNRYDTDPEPNGRLRPRGESPADPDRYPIGQGVTMTDRGMDDICGRIRKAAADLGTPVALPTDPPSTDTPSAKDPATAPAAAAPATAPPGGYLPKVEGDAATTAAPAVAPGDVEASKTGASADAAAGGAPGRAVPPGLVLVVMLGVGAAAVGAALVLSRGQRP